MIWRLFLRENLVGVGFTTAGIAAWAAFAPEAMRAPIASGLLPVLLIPAAPGKRATLFEAALPIPARPLFSARLLFLLASIWGPVVAVGIVAEIAHEPGWWAAGLALTASAVFALTSRIEQFGVHAMSYVVAAFVLAILTFTPYGVVVGAACGVAAVWRLADAWGRIPPSFQAAPVEPREARVSRAPSRPAFAALPVVRSMFPPMALIVLAVTLVQALLGMWMFTLILGATFVGATLRSTRWLWAMPLSRRSLLLVVAGPYLACLFGGMVAGAWLQPPRFEGWNLLPVDADASVPVEEWRLARGGAPPEIQAPWGETARPIIKRFPGFVAYTPFTMGRDNSRRFHDWQFARATKAVYGQALSPAEVRERRRELRPMSRRLRALASLAGLVAALSMVALFCYMAIQWRPVTDLPKPVAHSVVFTAMLLAFVPALPGVSTAITVVALRISPAVSLLVAAAAWLLLEWQSRTMEQGRPAPLTR